MIIDDIKKSNIAAMRDKNSNLRNIYSVLINKHMQSTIESRTSGKAVDDNEMIRIIQKTLKELDEEMANYIKVNNMDQVENIKAQNNAISKYLPQMVSEQEIYNFISKMDDKSVPNVMRTLRAEFGSTIDMKLASEVLKKFNS